jgi:IS30 family transposase
MNRQQCPQQAIAEAIGVDPSTISRELRRAGMNLKKAVG